MKTITDYIDDPNYGLDRDLNIGDQIMTTDDHVYTVTKLEDGIAYYDHKVHERYGDPASRLVDACFIWRFNTNGKGFTYNRVFRHCDMIKEKAIEAKQLLGLIA